MNTALKNIRRSPYQALAAILMTGLTVFVVALFALVSLASHEILTNFETKPQIIAYLKDSHTQDQVSQLIKSLSDTGLTKKVSYVSKDQALEIYKKSVGNDPLLLGTVTDLGVITADVLPASVEVTAKSPEGFKELAAVLEKSDIVSASPQGKKEIDYPQDVISELTSWTRGIRSAGLVLIAVLCLNSIITIMVVVSMKISSRRLEIHTMKLMGAKGGFIIKPYLIESMIYGFAGSLIGWLGAFIALLYSTPFLAPRLTGIVSLPVDFTIMLILLGGLAAGFIILGLFSGILASLRFMKK